MSSAAAKRPRTYGRAASTQAKRARRTLTPSEPDLDLSSSLPPSSSPPPGSLAGLPSLPSSLCHPSAAGKSASSVRSSSPPASSNFQSEQSSSPWRISPHRCLASVPDPRRPEPSPRSSPTPPSRSSSSSSSFLSILPSKAKSSPRPSSSPSAASGTRRAQKQPTLRSFFLPAPSSTSSSSSSSSRPPHPSIKTSSSSRCFPQQQLQQTHLVPPPPIKTCQVCQMTYQPLAPADEATHAKHHRGVVEGLDWLPDASSSSSNSMPPGVRVVEDSVRFGKNGRGRILCVDGSVEGRVAKRLAAVHALIDTHLSSPALPPHVLAQTKTFLLLSSSPPPSANGRSSKGTPTASSVKEVIIGACVVQQISTALRVLSPAEVISRRSQSLSSASAPSSSEKLVVVEPDAASSPGGVFCDPTPIPTALGIHRVHTSSSHSRQGIASLLLDAACANAIFGVKIKVGREGVAFSQPTGSGRALMERWGGGNVRVFVEDA